MNRLSEKASEFFWSLMPEEGTTAYKVATAVLVACMIAVSMVCAVLSW